MLQHDRAGRALVRPRPVLRGRVRAGLAVVGAIGLSFVPFRYGAGAFVGAGLVLVVAVAFLPRVLVTTPYPAFLTLRTVQAAALQPQSWIRLRSGWAVQVMNVNLRVPDTVGDPTPPEVRVRCSDGVTRRFRPHDSVGLVQPVDLRPRREAEDATIG